MKNIILIVLLSSFFCNAQWIQTSLSGNINGLIERNNTLFAATSVGLYMSTNGGITFSNIPLPSTTGPQYTYSFARKENSLIVSTGQGILISESNDAVWNIHSTQFTYGYFFNFKGILLNEVTGNFYRSTDFGISWQQIQQLNAPFNYTITSDSTNIYFGSYSGGIQISSDSGKTWNATNIAGETNIISMVSYDGKIIVSANVDTNRIYQSTDQGVTWTKIAERPVAGFVKSMFVVGNTIFADANYGKFHRSIDGGITWINIHSGLSNSISYYSSHEIISDTLYIGTGSSSGVWKRALSDFGITNIFNEFIGPSSVKLYQNYPNPFNPSTTISYQLSVGGMVSLKVFDVLGNEVANLINEEQAQGSYSVNFNSNSLSSGIYFYRLSSGKFLETKSMLLIK